MPVSDYSIVQALRQNAKRPYTEMAKSLGVSDTAIRKRVKKLEKKGIIRKYTVEVDTQRLGYRTALIGIDTVPEKLISALDKLNETEEIDALYQSSGDHMIMIEYWFQTPQELSQFIRGLEQMEGVTKVCPAILLDRIK
ncbi:MAG: Lrp/AsnC family transcriptional regulator [Candidatus Heimdallarchaeota archaeon]